MSLKTMKFPQAAVNKNTSPSSSEMTDWGRGWGDSGGWGENGHHDLRQWSEGRSRERGIDSRCRMLRGTGKASGVGGSFQLYIRRCSQGKGVHTHTHTTLHASAKQNFLGQIQTAPLISSSCGVGFLSHLSPHLPFGTLIPLFQGYPRIGKKKKKTHIFDAQEGVGIMIIFTLTVTLTNKVGLSDTFGKE